MNFLLHLYIIALPLSSSLHFELGKMHLRWFSCSIWLCQNYER